MELSYEVKQQIDSFITQCESWLLNEPKPPKLKLESKFGAVEDYLISKEFHDRNLDLSIIELIDNDILKETFKKDYPDFNTGFGNSCSNEIWDLWYELRDGNTIDTICVDLFRSNPAFDWDAGNLDEDNYHIAEYISIHLHLDYREGVIYLEVFDENCC